MNNNIIHHTAIIGDEVKLGNNNRIGPYSIIIGNVEIGDNNTFHSFTSIGNEPEHKEFFNKPNKGTIIGNNNIFREYVTVNSGCFEPTKVGNSNLFLRGSHVGHDTQIKNNCTISCNVLIGGHSKINNNVNMGLGSICHQFTEIAPYSMIGMGAIITKKVKPTCFGVFVGNPAYLLKENSFLKNKLSENEIKKIILLWDKNK